MLSPTDPNEIVNVVRNFKSKNSNLNSIPSFMFKHVVTKIAPVISDLINSSFDEGIFQDELKTARVVPIFKSGQSDVVLNYRPIATLPFLSKIYERVLFNSLTAFFKKV